MTDIQGHDDMIKRRMIMPDMKRYRKRRGKKTRRFTALLLSVLTACTGIGFMTGCDSDGVVQLMGEIVDEAELEGLLDGIALDDAPVNMAGDTGGTSQAAPAGSYEAWLAAPSYEPYKGSANVKSTSDLYTEINGGQPFFTDEERRSTEAFENYSELDMIGRCGPAYANLCHELMPTEQRTDISSVKPSGWHSVKYDPSLVAGGSLWNRSHLIAFSLAGENANRKNLITGTSMFNQVVMQIYESAVLSYLHSSDNHVLYRVTPVFEGDELVARGVLMEAYSVEDSGHGICYNVFCYNVQPGIYIDYATGESAVESSLPAGASGTSGQGQTAGPDQDQHKYLLNVKTKKFHLPECHDADSISEQNRREIKCSRQELVDQGYSPCGSCKP